jgi:hypothetical protein
MRPRGGIAASRSQYSAFVSAGLLPILSGGNRLISGVSTWDQYDTVFKVTTTGTWSTVKTSTLPDVRSAPGSLRIDELRLHGPPRVVTLVGRRRFGVEAKHAGTGDGRTGQGRAGDGTDPCSGPGTT